MLSEIKTNPDSGENMPNNFLFNLIAPLYDRIFEVNNSEILRDLLQLKSDQFLLDAGGGTGRVSEQFQNDVHKLILGDFSFAMLRQAKKKNTGNQLQISSLELPFPDQSFDRILVVDALHHFPEQRQAVVELLRVLKTGGRLVIEEPNILYFEVKIIALLEKLALMGSHFHTPHEIRAMVQAEDVQTSVHLPKGHIAWIVAEK